MSGFDAMGLETPNEDLDAIPTLCRIAAEMAAAKGEGRSVPKISVVEVGSWAGNSTIRFAESDHVGHVYAVDHWRGNSDDSLKPMTLRYGPTDAFRTFCKNLGHHLFQKVTPCRGPSALWAESWPHHRRVELVYLDAGHSYDAVCRNILEWLPKVAPGGIIAGHDYGVADLPGVKQAVDQHFGRNVMRLGACIWYAHVKA